MIFIDSSAYLALLIPTDSNNKKAQQLLGAILKNADVITSYAILGEVLTIGSMRFNRQAAIEFVADVIKSKTTIVMEDHHFMKRGMEIFKDINDKDVGWVDCYSFAIIERYKVEKVFSFDRDFRKYVKAEILE